MPKEKRTGGHFVKYLIFVLYPEIILQIQNHLKVQYTIQQQTAQNVKR